MASSEWYRERCALCGELSATRDLDRIKASAGPYGVVRHLAYTCRNCTARVVEFLSVEMPDLDAPRTRRGVYQWTWCPKCAATVAKRDRYCKNCGEKLEGNPWVGRIDEGEEVSEDG